MLRVNLSIFTRTNFAGYPYVYVGNLLGYHLPDVMGTGHRLADMPMEVATSGAQDRRSLGSTSTFLQV